jgi:hypothetical protein
MGNPICLDNNSVDKIPEKEQQQTVSNNHIYDVNNNDIDTLFMKSLIMGDNIEKQQHQHTKMKLLSTVGFVSIVSFVAGTVFGLAIRIEQ